MKQLITLFLISIFSISVFSQSKSHSDYENDSKWFIGLNAGGLWHTTDVKNKTQIGWGAMIGRSFLYNYGRPISLDVRARFLRGFWVGQDTKLTAVSPTDPAFNGSEGQYTNYLDSANGMVLRNFQADVYRGSIELAVHVNALRERTGIDLYVFGGIGLTWYQTFGNLFLADSTSKTMYDYSTLQSHSQSGIKGFQDKTYDTPLNGSQRNKYSMAVMPSIGIGIGYQITPRFQLGIEHKTTFTRGDLFDGKNYDGNLQPSKTKDLYHYTSLYIKVNFRKIGSKPIRDIDEPIDSTAVSNPITNSTTNLTIANPPVVTPPCLAPSVTIVDPRANYTTTNDRFVIAAQLTNVTNRQQISFKQNGVENTNYQYNTSTHQFEAGVVLAPGQNIFEVTVSNECGTFSDSRVIILERPQVAPPIISYQNPSYSPYSGSTPSFPLNVKILNIEQSNQVKMSFNGVIWNSFSFNGATHVLISNLQLIEGANIVEITATNVAGTDSKSTVIIYKEPFERQAPIVQFIQPNQNPYTINENTAPITASVFNVDSKSNITVTINGINWTNFNYNKSTQIVTFIASSLIYGTNVINIKGVNEVGQDAKSTTLIYQRSAPKTPPLVNFIDPIVNPQTSIASSYNVKVLVRYVLDKQHVEVKINGNSTTNFNYNSSAQTIDFQTSLLNGANSIYVRGVNTDGEAEATTTIIYRQPNLTLPPQVVIVSPDGNPATSYSASSPAKATIQNVTQKSEIQVFVNTVSTTNFTYNILTKEVDLTVNLNLGMNTIRVVATNSAGQNEDNQQINYIVRAVVAPPTLMITQPSVTGTTVSLSNYTFKAITTNVNAKSDVSVHFNGIVVPINAFDFVSEQITYDALLLEGTNLFEISATNSGGTVTQSTIIKYVKREAPCDKPTLSWLVPAQNGTLTEDSMLTFKVQTNFVESANELSFKLNGNMVGAANFDANSKQAQKLIQLSEGMNVLELTARTKCGLVTITRIIEYKKPAAPCDVPSVSAIKPSILDLQMQTDRFDFYASTVNITSEEQVIAKLNGEIIRFKFDSIAHTIQSRAMLVPGNNVITIYVSNDCGSSSLTWSVNNVICEKPIFELSSDIVNGESTSNPNFTLTGLVKNVDNASSLVLKLNGNPINFIFNATTGAFSANLNLTKGSNEILLYMENACGETSFPFKRIFVPPLQEKAPIVQITNPVRSPDVSLSPTIIVTALVQNITNPSNISVKVNGASVSFNFADEKVNFNQLLINGSNTITITVANTAGTDSDSKIINYQQKQIVLAPVVQITNPSEVSETIDGLSYTIKGVVKNVSNYNQVQVYINGVALSDFNPILENNEISFSFPLAFDNSHTSYSIKVVSTNEAGTHQDTKSIHKKIVIPITQPIRTTEGSIIQGGTTTTSPVIPGSVRAPVITRPTTTIVRPTGQR